MVRQKSKKTQMVKRGQKPGTKYKPRLKSKRKATKTEAARKLGARKTMRKSKRKRAI
jgi:hypothetical protein